MRIVILAVLGLLAAPVAHAAPDHRAMAMAAVDGHMVPGYRHFHNRAEALQRGAAGFCAAPDSAGLAALRTDFHAAMDAWQGVQHVTYGPVEAFHRGQRIHFWPDKKNAGDRQMLALLKERKAEMLEPSRIALASVAVQGLPALEMLLFGEGQADRLLVPGDEAAFRCRVLTAIAANVTIIGVELVADWTKSDGFRTAIDDAGSPTSPYLDHRQAASHLFNALHGQLQAIAEVKLGHPLGNGVDDARPGRSENWRSKRSLRNVAVNLKAMRATFVTAFSPALTGEANARFLAALDRAATAAQGGISTAAQGGISTAAQGGISMEEGMITPDGWKRLSALKTDIKAAARQLEAEIGPALGLQIGFNALDGD
jgi:predicted lipoprotein